ncbi:response regulator [Pedobacter aquatilis]|uniref:response regulator n=1 Tax=Pedobacter aquatilis TaxID=351343 RepID=UPI00292E83BC|nr:response regulator [Pedobacter aquatilis]
MKKPKILIIDDDIDILELIGIIVLDAGFEPILRKSVMPAEELLRIKPELILLDVRIAGSPLNGDEFCRQLKRGTTAFTIPVVLVSAERNLEQIAKKCAADGFISKPFDIDKIVKVVRKFVP